MLDHSTRILGRSITWPEKLDYPIENKVKAARVMRFISIPPAPLVTRFFHRLVTVTSRYP
jgi:hypothetical protein